MWPLPTFPQVGAPLWQVKDSNLRRHKPTDLQSVPIGRSGNLPSLLTPAGTGPNGTKG